MKGCDVGKVESACGVTMGREERNEANGEEEKRDVETCDGGSNREGGELVHN